jgi:hypothetical protein
MHGGPASQVHPVGIGAMFEQGHDNAQGLLLRGPMECRVPIAVRLVHHNATQEKHVHNALVAILGCDVQRSLERFVIAIRRGWEVFNALNPLGVRLRQVRRLRYYCQYFSYQQRQLRQLKGKAKRPYCCSYLCYVARNHLSEPLCR